MAERLRPISEIAEQLDLGSDEWWAYGPYKAKITLEAVAARSAKPRGQLILVTAMTPTPAGEGKTTTTVGLAEAFCQLGQKAIAAIREPSLGPVMGMKGGGTGGGQAEVRPAVDINLHFNGDLHAIAAAHNLLAAMVDNELYHGGPSDLDPRKISWPRAIDMNDRALRHVVVGLGDGPSRETQFVITAASEIMAILCLASSLADLKERLGQVVVGQNRRGENVTAADLGAHGAMSLLLRDALMPNLVQTADGTPAVVHGGPFANIAHGSSSILATRFALGAADYVVTEAGFGADLGAEKFFDLVSRVGGFEPQVVVLVATVQALKWHGGVPKKELEAPNRGALETGFANLERHIRLIQSFGLQPVVAINRFPTDQESELETLLGLCSQAKAPSAVSEVFAKGGTGGKALAEAVLAALREPRQFRRLYPLPLPLAEKITRISQEVYGAKDVVFAPAAMRHLEALQTSGHGKLPVVMAKTQYSFSDDPKLLGAPRDFVIHVQEVRLAAGAGFVVALTGQMMTMPGLPKHPSALDLDVDPDGTFSGSL